MFSHRLTLCALAAMTPISLAQTTQPDLTVNTNLVVVPTLVLSATGEITHLLTASEVPGEPGLTVAARGSYWLSAAR